MATGDRWLQRVNALLLAAWLGMVAAHVSGRDGDPAARPAPGKGGWFAPVPGFTRLFATERPGPASPQVEPAAAGAGAAPAARGEGEEAASGKPGGADRAGAVRQDGAAPGSSPWSIPPAVSWARPLDAVATVTSLFGPRDGRWHHGVDLAVPAGTAVRSVWQGTVRQAGWRGAYGLAVEVAHPGGWSTLYGHLASVAVEPGQRVARGQLLGRVGATGRATGPHLHLEVRVPEGFFDPLAWLDRRWYRWAVGAGDGDAVGTAAVAAPGGAATGSGAAGGE
ncbi:Peptidase M23 [Thermaerobacter marianensis DSM 12885]|uniref:Peptidase M23 n=1 Tax=Thermaerobacter marianensis (strain ATCC 700841 / DSM 12885 / JCM 10246 / 7p75a) TaxID=644966 RepID=E6SLL0_THEM7|nr:M23 family metallopeptidase [Thermaerobacter marianensis]ADU50277.1 Peptidase M23 [Thermaerobacter marianensis DSM 12885]